MQQTWPNPFLMNPTAATLTPSTATATTTQKSSFQLLPASNRPIDQRPPTAPIVSKPTTTTPTASITVIHRLSLFLYSLFFFQKMPSTWSDASNKLNIDLDNLGIGHRTTMKQSVSLNQMQQQMQHGESNYYCIDLVETYNSRIDHRIVRH